MPPTIAEMSQSAATQVWVLGAVGVCGGLPGLVAVISLFATRREMQSLEAKVIADKAAMDQRLTRMEDHLDAVQRDIHQMENRITAAGETRAEGIHERINQILSAVSEVRGQIAK
jgi:hypothetical protein